MAYLLKTTITIVRLYCGIENDLYVHIPTYMLIYTRLDVRGPVFVNARGPGGPKYGPGYLYDWHTVTVFQYTATVGRRDGTGLAMWVMVSRRPCFLASRFH